MEDLESPSSQTGTTDTATPVATSVVTTATTVSKEPVKKRQLNLTDMFSVTPGTKRQRTTSTGSASSASGAAGTSGPPRLVNGLRPFNSIPFNMEVYQSSLSEEEKKLLTLECETMGRTWVSPRAFPVALAGAHDSSLTRSDLNFGRFLERVAEGSIRRDSQAIFP
jgi:hypothetical protein